MGVVVLVGVCNVYNTKLKSHSLKLVVMFYTHVGMLHVFGHVILQPP